MRNSCTTNFTSKSHVLLRILLMYIICVQYFCIEQNITTFRKYLPNFLDSVVLVCVKTRLGRQKIGSNLKTFANTDQPPPTHLHFPVPRVGELPKILIVPSYHSCKVIQCHHDDEKHGKISSTYLSQTSTKSYSMTVLYFDIWDNKAGR